MTTNQQFIDITVHQLSNAYGNLLLSDYRGFSDLVQAYQKVIDEITTMIFIMSHSSVITQQDFDTIMDRFTSVKRAMREMDKIILG